jgi:hypothetical protein
MNISISVPEELYNKAVEIAEAQRVSVDDVFASALAQQLAAEAQLRERANRGNRDRFLEVLDKAPNVEPDDYDRLLDT